MGDAEAAGVPEQASGRPIEQAGGEKIANGIAKAQRGGIHGHGAHVASETTRHGVDEVTLEGEPVASVQACKSVARWLQSRKIAAGLSSVPFGVHTSRRSVASRTRRSDASCALPPVETVATVATVHRVEPVVVPSALSRCSCRAEIAVSVPFLFPILNGPGQLRPVTGGPVRACASPLC